MKQEYISIIIPIYNIEKYLDECIASVLAQTYQKIEIILVDDGSTDSSSQICDKWKKIDDRIIVIHQKNSGPSVARNRGIDLANGEYLCFIDSDDLVAPEYLSLLKNYLVEYNADMSFCDFLPFSKKTQAPKKGIFEGIVCLQKADMMGMLPFYLQTVVVWNKLIKRSTWGELKFPEDKYIHEDEFIIHNLIDRCNRIVYLKQKNYFYRKREMSITEEVKTTDFRHLDLVDIAKKRVKLCEAECYRTCYPNIVEGYLKTILEQYTYISQNPKNKKQCKILHQEGIQAFHQLGKALPFKKQKKYEFYIKIPKIYVWKLNIERLYRKVVRNLQK